VWGDKLVGASGLDVTRLLALVTNTLAGGLRGAVAGEVTNFTTWRSGKYLFLGVGLDMNLQL
jgi:hypothetical protein